MIVNAIKVICADIFDIFRIVAGLLLLGSLLVVCVALATLLSYAIILDPNTGIVFFHQIMGMQVTGLIDIVRIPLATLNWTVLGLLPLWLLASPCKLYLQGVASRAKSLEFKATNSDEPHDNGGPDLRAAA